MVDRLAVKRARWPSARCSGRLPSTLRRLENPRWRGNLRMVDRAYDFFCLAEREGRVLSIDDICTGTGWAQSTVRTRTKKLWSAFLWELGGLYRCRGVVAISREQFRQLHSQTVDDLAVEIPGMRGVALPLRFRYIREPGAGGYGRVFLCEDLDRHTEVAVKVLFPHLCTDRNVVDSLRREIKAADRMGRPDMVVPIYEVSEFQGTHYLVMEFAPGGSLEDRMSSPPDLGEVATRQLATRIAEILAVAHECGVIHRDLKPANVLMDDQRLCRLCDFGVSRVLAEATRLMSLATAVGTEAYGAPEILDQSGFGCRSDIFSLGIRMFEMATGVIPQRTRRMRYRVQGVEQDEPPDPRALDDRISESFATLVTAMIDPDQDRRPSCALDVVARLAPGP